MKKFTKLILSCAAVATLAAGTTAMAAGLDSLSYADGTLTIGEYASTGTQQTILVLSEDAENVTEAIIKQIDQKEGAFASVPVGDLADGTYYVRIGGDSAAQFLSGTFTVGGGAVTKTQLIGDVTNEGDIDTSDAIAVIDHYLEVAMLEGDALLAADTNDDGEADTTDAIDIIEFYLETGNSTIDGVTTIQ